MRPISATPDERAPNYDPGGDSRLSDHGTQITMSAHEELKKLLDLLATQRDELIVQAHLAKLEAQGEWGRLEKQLDQLREKAAEAAVVTGDTARGVLETAKLAGEEIARGYERLRKTL